MSEGPANPELVQVRAACRLAPGALVLLLEIDPAAGAVNRWRAHARGEGDGDPTQLHARWMACRVGGGGPADNHWLLTIDGPPVGDGPAAGVVLGDGKKTAGLSQDAIAAQSRGPAEFAEACASLLDMAGRSQAATFLAGAPRAHSVQATPALSEAMLAIRDILRPSLPPSVVRAGAACAIRLGDVIRVDERSFWLGGWLHADQPTAAQLTAIAPEGMRSSPRRGAVTLHRRADLEGKYEGIRPIGFSAFIELDAPSLHPNGWLLELRPPGSSAVEVAAHNAVVDDVGVLRRQLRLDRFAPLEAESFENQLLPVATRLAGSSAGGEIEDVVDYGPPPPEPAVSIVIATSAIDRIEHQLLEFVRDPGLETAEIIYAIPRDPDEELEALAHGLSSLHRIPFRIVRVSRLATCARSFNLGASVARSDLLVLMSGDTIATSPGWLGTMRSFLQATPDAGAVGPLLLFEDDSIADAGASYVRDAGSGRWTRVSPLRGLAPTLPGATEARAAQALTGGCIMLSADRWRTLGGFSELYMENGDEAGDLCLALGEAGAGAWYLPDARMHLLERETWPVRPTAVTDAYNAWLFERRWGARLAETN